MYKKIFGALKSMFFISSTFQEKITPNQINKKEKILNTINIKFLSKSWGLKSQIQKKTI